MLLAGDIDRIGRWQRIDGRSDPAGAAEPDDPIRARPGGASGPNAAAGTGPDEISDRRRVGINDRRPGGTSDRRRAEISDRRRVGTSDRRGNRPAGLARKADEPTIPEGVDIRTLHRAVRAELRSLPKDLAETVAGHLVMAGQLIDEDPELAYAHAEAARRRVARLPIVREAAAETAYAAGHYDVALSEFRALRRMTGPRTTCR